VSKKPTIPIESRIDLFSLVDALLYLQEQGYHPSTRSALVSMCVKVIGNLLPEEQRTTSAENALHLLQQAFGSDIKLGKTERISAAVRTALQQEALKEVDHRKQDGVISLDELEKAIKSFKRE
jgi:hypothetical protein